MAAWRRISDASADAGGAISAVTASAPDARIRSRRLPARIARLAASPGIAGANATGAIEAWVDGTTKARLPAVPGAPLEREDHTIELTRMASPPRLSQQHGHAD